MSNAAQSGLKIVTDFEFDEADLQLIRTAAGDQARLEVARDVASLRHALATAEVLCSSRLPRDLAAVTPRLRWLHYPIAGIDKLLAEGIITPQTTFAVTTVSSANASSVAEYIFSSMLIFARQWDAILRNNQHKYWAESSKWHVLRGFEWRGKTMGIIGLGAIGRHVAHLARAFEMQVLGLRRTVQPGQIDPDCDRLYDLAQLHDLLAESDVVVLSVPLTDATRGLIGARELQQMRASAYLINVSRGAVIDEPALILALRDRQIAGAGLDVVAQEPLSAASPLWSLPGVILSPHLSSLTTGYTQRVAQHFAANIERFLAGEPLLDHADPARGY